MYTLYITVYFSIKMRQNLTFCCAAFPVAWVAILALIFNSPLIVQKIDLRIRPLIAHFSRDARDITTNCDPGDPVPPNRVDTTERLADLRAEMDREDLDGYIVPWDEEGRRAWISGFTGSAGDAIIIADQVRQFQTHGNLTLF